jgi:hypothetical protein
VGTNHIPQKMENSTFKLLAKRMHKVFVRSSYKAHSKSAIQNPIQIPVISYLAQCNQDCASVDTLWLPMREINQQKEKFWLPIKREAKSLGERRGELPVRVKFTHIVLLLFVLVHFRQMFQHIIR